jgi:prohibitin 2
MSDPRQTWQRLQQSLQQQGRGSGFPGGGFPSGGRALGGAGGLLLLGVGGYVLLNSLFNG